MKFSGRYLQEQPAVSFANTVQIREIRKEKDGIYIYALPYVACPHVFGGPMIEIYISSPRPDIFRVQTQHFSGSRAKMPEFDLNVSPVGINTEESDNKLIVRSGNSRLEICKNPVKFSFYYKDRLLTSVGSSFGQTILGYVSAPEGKFMRAQLDLDIGEKVYGLGERFTPFVKNGQSVDIWNEDGGTCSDLAYKNIPFYITNRGYGVFVNDTGRVSFEVCSEQVTRVQFSVPGEKLDFMIIGGGDMKEVISNYTALTGCPALPPAWTFGLWLTSSFTTSYDEKTVGEMVEGMRSRSIPMSVFHFDCFWMRENEWCGFEWDKSVFGDPEGMLSRMKETGLKICVWINPYLGQKSPLFKEAMEHNYLLNRPNGDVWQWDLWQAGMGIVDFTNPDAYKWYQSKLRRLLEQGIDAFKTDFGERIPTDVCYFDGSDPERMHNYYTYLYNKCVFEVIEEYKGKNEAVVFARSATAGCQKFPVHWGGDCLANYLSMWESLRAGLSLCLSGFSFWSHDIGGFEGTACADVYKRWLAFGLLSTHSRLHGASSYRVPWLFNKEGETDGAESVAVAKFFSELKCTLMPYIYEAAVTAHKTGVPVMRAMVLEYTDDFICEDLDRQYMLGDRMLVAPVFRKNGDVDYYLPKGRWTHLLSNEIREGGAWQKDNNDFFSLPLYVRENSIVPIGADNTRPDYDYAENITLHIFELKDRASARICDTHGKEIFKAEAVRDNNRITVSLDSLPLGAKVLLRNIYTVKSVSGAVASSDELGTLLCLNSKVAVIEL